MIETGNNGGRYAATGCLSINAFARVRLFHPAIRQNEVDILRVGSDGLDYVGAGGKEAECHLRYRAG